MSQSLNFNNAFWSATQGDIKGAKESLEASLPNLSGDKLSEVRDILGELEDARMSGGSISTFMDRAIAGLRVLEDN